MSQKLWFKRKWFGWGWYPASWQGWLVTVAYAAIVIALAISIDGRETTREAVFVFWLPLVLLTTTLIRICYAKGEKPRWQWGKEKKDE